MFKADYYSCMKELILDHQANLDDFIRWARVFQSWPCQRRVVIRGREFIIVHAGYIKICVSFRILNSTLTPKSFICTPGRMPSSTAAGNMQRSSLAYTYNHSA